MAAGGEFVEGWLVAQVLGEGAYGEVRLLLHARSGAAVALKVVRGGAGGGEGAAEREARLHRALRHPHVLRCLGARAHAGQHYLFLEWAAGGELFQRIEPDAGMRAAAARRYWRQLLAGLRYLHARGVAHRDLKPENVLLDHRDDVKISDFGMATLFRHGSRERLLSRVCGTAPYAAPEVLRAAAQPYRAPPADLWAAALVLLAMLAGELPWQRAHPDDPRFAAWQDWAAADGAPPPAGPWRKLGAPALALLRRALAPDPARRASLDALLQHAWTAAPDEPAPDEPDAPRARGRASPTWRSQPARAAARDGDGDGDALSAADMDALIGSSQPAAADDLLLAGERLGPLARRMTRVWLRAEPPRALAALAAALDARGLPWRRVRAHELAVDGGAELRMRAVAVRGGAGVTLLEFRRTRGCGLQFKRRFVELREALRPLETSPPGADGDDPMCA